MRRCELGVVGAVALAVLGTSSPARGYEFEVHARTIGQGYSLTSFRPLSGDLSLQRRRFTTTLSLDIWDLAGRIDAMKLYAPQPRGPRIYISTYMRLDHDFGSWTGGELTLGTQTYDAVDLIPELETGSLSLDVLYGYVAAEALLDGALDVRVGRLLEVDALDWYSFDGAKARVVTPLGFAVEGFGGLRVRDGSPVGSNVVEPDGTSGGECAEYIEGDTPGAGSWQRIDRGQLGGNPFTSDLELCPQRSELMPTFGGAVETAGLERLFARVGYRRSQSRTPGLIGDPDRFDPPDVGFYPNEHGQAPPWGVNEEMVAATVRYRFDYGRGKGQVTPYAAARYSLLHALIDEGHVGARVRYGAHSVEPEVYYSFPTFDGDSIFNVFSSEPYADARLSYHLRPRRAPWQAYVRGWARRFVTEDAADADDPVDRGVYAGGGQLGALYRRDAFSVGRIDLFHEDGLGGRRTGGFLSGRWKARRNLRLAARASVIDFAADTLADYDGVSVGGQLGVTYLINLEGLAVHAIAEETSNRFNRSALRAILVIDLAFRPEVP